MRVAASAARQAPERYPLVYREFRRVLLRRFPYALIFRESNGEIVVLACFHHRRDPRG